MADAGELPEYRLYDYDPNLPANVVFTVLFSIVTIGQFYFLIRKRTWYFLAFAIACLCKCFFIVHLPSSPGHGTVGIC